MVDCVADLARFQEGTYVFLVLFDLSDLLLLSSRSSNKTKKLKTKIRVSWPLVLWLLHVSLNSLCMATVSALL